MGIKGPVPNRSDQRRRTNEPAIPITSLEIEGPVAVPDSDPDWHPVALTWYQSLAESGQSKFYEPSDWATAYLIAESLSRDLLPQVIGIAEKTGEIAYEVIPLKGASLSAYLRAFSVLMVTEGDRRRLSLELKRDQTKADPDAERAGATVTNLLSRLGG
jgi:hypothetical protein